MRYVSVVGIIAFSFACSFSVPVQKYGIENDGEAKKIQRANEFAKLRDDHQYELLSQNLESELKNNPGIYAQLRIRNELADLYTNHLMDIEAAITQDEHLGMLEGANGQFSFAITTFVASNKIISNRAYVDRFINMPEAEIKKIHKNRLSINRDILLGKETLGSSGHTVDFLVSHLNRVIDDLSSTHLGSVERIQIISRLVRAEYELYRKTGDEKYIDRGFLFFLDGSVDVYSFDYSEIDFLSLSKYLQISYEKSNNMRIAEASLQSIYRPYINLRNVESRWTYNKLVNELLNSLIETSYRSNRYEDMLYFASLNKSRMILEDQANNIRDKNSNLSSIIKNLKTLDKSTGLPSRELFLEKLKLAKNYLDIYVVGSYKITQKNSAEYAKARLESSQAISSTRAVGVARKANTEEIPVTNKLIVSYIKNGKVVSVEQKSMAEANQLQAEYDTLYENVSGGSEQIRGIGVTKTKPRSSIISSVKNRLYSGTLDDDLAVSPDKWVSKYPFSYLFGARTTRSLNLLSLGDSKDLRDIKLVGYFNPLIDHPRGPLPGAEEEAKIIKKIIPDAEIHLRADASLRTINQPSTSNIVHLSMHGMNNSEEPTYSKLLFAGSSFNESNTDVNALYAKDMLNISQLKGNELIFTAACETGLTRGSSKNASELIGILRPLLINDNKNIILTLWEVDDASTMDFVRYFYQDLARGKNIKTAFYRAVDELKKKYPNPSDWAAFYLIQNG